MAEPVSSQNAALLQIFKVRQPDGAFEEVRFYARRDGLLVKVGNAPALIPLDPGAADSPPSTPCPTSPPSGPS